MDDDATDVARRVDSFTSARSSLPSTSVWSEMDRSNLVLQGGGGVVAGTGVNTLRASVAQTEVRVLVRPGRAIIDIPS